MFLDIDLNVAKALNAFLNNTNGAFTKLFKLITSLGDKGWFFLLVTLALCLFKKTRKKGFHLIFAIGFSIVAMYLIKNIVRRPRPFIDETSEYYKFWVEAGKLEVSSYSFPSGHSTISMAFAVSLFLTSNKKYSYVFFIFPLLIGLTRIYFNVHFFSDVIGGFFVAILFSIISYFVFEYVYNNYYLKKINNKNEDRI